MNKYTAILISNQKELYFAHKIYNFETFQDLRKPIWMYFNEDYRYIGHQFLYEVKDPIKEYPGHDFTIIDIKNLIRIEKLKRINTE